MPSLRPLAVRFLPGDDSGREVVCGSDAGGDDLETLQTPWHDSRYCVSGAHFYVSSWGHRQDAGPARGELP